MIFILVSTLLFIGATTKKMKYINLKKHFENYEGAFVLYNMTTDTYSVYNEKQCLEPISPSGTFEIMSTLIGLEVGIINEDTVFHWNEKLYPPGTGNEDKTVIEAFKQSKKWCYQELARQIGNDRMKTYLGETQYGNGDIRGGIDQFWLDSSLKISLIEQIDFLKKLYLEQLPFKKENVEFVKQMLMNEPNEEFNIYGKTSLLKDGASLFVGYIEYREEPYFFATLVRGESSDSKNLAKKITLKILKMNKWK